MTKCKIQKIHNKKISPIIFVIISLFFVFQGNAKDLSAIKSRGYINVCYTPWLGTASVKEEYGADFEAAKVFAEYLGLKPHFKMIKWDEQFISTTDPKKQNHTPDLLANGTCDFYASNITKNPIYDGKLAIVPIFPSRMMIVTTKKNYDSIKEDSSLAGKSTYVIQGTTYERWLQQENRKPIFKQNPIRIHSIQDGSTVDYLLKGDADFIVLDAYLALFTKMNDKYTEIEMAFPVGKTEEVGWGFRLIDKNIISKFSEFFSIEKERSESKINKIFKKFYGSNLKEISELTFSLSPKYTINGEKEYE